MENNYIDENMDEALNEVCFVCQERTLKIDQFSDRTTLQEKLISIDELNQDKLKLEKLIEMQLLKFREGNNITQANLRLRDLSNKIEEARKKTNEGYSNLSKMTVVIDNFRKLKKSIVNERLNSELTYLQKVDVHSHIKYESGMLGRQLENARWYLALELFTMMKICPSDSNSTIPMAKQHQTSTISPSNLRRKGQEHDKKMLSGCSTILGLPLTNKGDFSDLPIELVLSALSHVCHLVDSLSAVLHIPVPHRMKPFDTFDVACISTNFLEGGSSSGECLHGLNPATRIASEPRGDFQWTTLHMIEKPKHDDTNSPDFVSNDSYAVNNSFSLALMNLRANVIVLCLKAGIDPKTLHPSEAILLNLHRLHMHAIEQTKKHSTGLYIQAKSMPFQSQSCLSQLKNRYLSNRHKVSMKPEFVNNIDTWNIPDDLNESAIPDVRVNELNNDDLGWAVVNLDVAEDLSFS